MNDESLKPSRPGVVGLTDYLYVVLDAQDTRRGRARRCKTVRDRSIAVWLGNKRPKAEGGTASLASPWSVHVKQLWSLGFSEFGLS